MPGLLWLLVGIILLLLSFVLISIVIMPSLTILSTNSSLSIKRGDESERQCKSLNYLSIGGDPGSHDDEPDKVALNKVELHRVEINELNKAELRPPEVDKDAGSGLIDGTKAAAKETSSTENVNKLKTVDMCIDSVESVIRDPNDCDFNGDVGMLQSISDDDLKIARLETLPICSNDFNGIKVAKVIRTRNLYGANGQTRCETDKDGVKSTSEACQRIQWMKHSNKNDPGNRNELLQEQKSDSSEKQLDNRKTTLQRDVDEKTCLPLELTNGDNLVPNFIIGDKFYNYDLSSHADASAPLVVPVQTDATPDLSADSTPTNTADEDVPYIDTNELKRKKRRKRNKCMEIFNVPIEILNRIEEETPGANGPSHDLAAPKISEHVPDSELVHVDSDGQVMAGSHSRPEHAIGPNSSDLSFSWVFNHQLTSASQSFPSVYIASNSSGELNECTPSQTFDSFNKPVKRETETCGLNKSCDYNELNCDKERSKKSDIANGGKIHSFLKKNKMVEIKSKLKEVKIGKPFMFNGKVTREKVDRDANGIMIDSKIVSDSLTNEHVDTKHSLGFVSIPESCFNSPHSLFSDSLIDNCCSSDMHQHCSLISNLEVDSSAESSNAKAPAHFFSRNDSDMPPPSFTFNETFKFDLGPSDSLPNAQFSPAYFSRNSHVTNNVHSQKSISDLDFLIGSFQDQPKQTSQESYNSTSNSLSCLLTANNDLTNSDEESVVTISGNYEENALRSLDELCIKSLESIKSEPVSLSSTKSKKVTFLENDTTTNDLLADSEYPIEKTVNTIPTDFDDECHKGSDTLVEDDVMSLSSSTSSLTSSSSESSGQSMIFNGVTASAENMNNEKPEELPKMDAAVLKHTSIAHALNQHSFHTYLSPIREQSLEISADESDLTTEDSVQKGDKTLSLQSRENVEPEMDECVTSFSTFEHIVLKEEDKMCLVVAKVENVDIIMSQNLYSDKSNCKPGTTSCENSSNLTTPNNSGSVSCNRIDTSCSDTYTKSTNTSSTADTTPSNNDRISSKPANNFSESEENPETPIEPVVLNTKFIMAHLTNKADLTENSSGVAKPNSVTESDGLERCSGRAKTNSSESDLSSELEHILSSIDYESSRSEQSPTKYSPSNCSNQSDERFSPREQACIKDSSGSDCSVQSCGSVEADSQNRIASTCSGQIGVSNMSKTRDNWCEIRKSTRSSYLPLKKYELVNVPPKVTLSDEKESSSKYRQMVIEKIKNFENITTAHTDQPVETPRKKKVSKLREPIIKSTLTEKESSPALVKDSHLFNNSNFSFPAENLRLEAGKKIVQVPNVSDKVKCFEKKILDRENSKSPSPEPVDFKNIFSEKLSSFENLAKKPNIGSSLRSGHNIDIRVNVSKKLQSFENLSSSSRENSKSPDLTAGKDEDKSKSVADKIDIVKTKTPIRSIRSSYEEKLRNCQLFSSSTSTEVSKSNSPKLAKKQFDVLNRISSFESQIKTEAETPKKVDSPAAGLSKIPKMKTKSLECIFTSRVLKAMNSAERSNSVENISDKGVTSHTKIGSIVQVDNSQPFDSNLHRTVKISPPTPISQSLVNLKSSSKRKGIVSQLSSTKIPTGDLKPKGGDVSFSKPQIKPSHHQTETVSNPKVDQTDGESITKVECPEILDVISRDKCLQDVMNDSGITEDFEDGLKMNLSHNDVIVSQDRDVMEMMATIEAVERLADLSPKSHQQSYQRSILGADESDKCHISRADDIFFRSHVLPQLEAERDKKLSSRVIEFQAQCRGFLARKHLAKLKVQDVAVRCIQRNVRKFMDVRDWSWWRLYLKIHPILNVHRTDQELQAKSEELEALKSKLEKLEMERNILKQDNTRLETKLSEITEDYADEHSTATLATQRLNIESSERSRLEKELAEAQSANKTLSENSEKLEAEVRCLRSTPDALSLDADEGSDAQEGGGDAGGVYRKKWERAMRELELTKHRLSTQHQDDLEQLVGLRKQLEKKVSDAYEQVEEQRHVAAEWKRKVARVNAEMSDLRLVLEEQSSRNNLLEKKQRKFDAEFSMLQDELRQERNLKEKAMRDKELALGDKYTIEQSMSSLKLELELKDQKLSSLAQELEELTFSGNTEEEVANLKKKKHSLEAKIADQEEELDELAGQVQMLEQAKLKVEMSLEQLRKAHRKELASKDEELEALRCSTQKKVKALQSQLESEHESRSQLMRERHELERRLNSLEDEGVASQAAEAETQQRLKRDLKRTKALLKDTQTMLAQARQDNPNRLLVRQLRHQLEDAELGRSVATKAKHSLESDLADMSVSLDEATRAKTELEARLSEALRDRSCLQSTLDENEEEMTEVLKKYQTSVQQLSTEQSHLQESTTRIADLESENASLRDQLVELNSKLESIETHGDPSSTLALKRLQLKSKELESKLEFEHTTRSRLEVQINRLKETTEKLQSECNILRAKENTSVQDSRRLQRTIRELKESVQSLEARGINEALKRKELEKEVQCREAEINSLKNELSVASQRIQDLQLAIQGDLDDDEDDDSDARNSSSLSDDTKE